MTDSPKRIWATKDHNGETGSWNRTPSRMQEHMPKGWQTEYHRADISADLVRTALEAAFTEMRVFAPHEEHNTGPEHDIGYASGYHTAMHRTRALAADPEAVAAIVAQVMEGK